MREYIHFFENSDLRDAYEYGSDYTEPYVSYTPVINEYKVQFNGNNIPGFNITKQKNSYLIQSNNGNLIIMNPEPPIVNSNVFYTLIPFKVSTKAVVIPATRMFIIEEDLQLTEESTEFTFNEVTYYLRQEDVNRWNVYTDSEHTQNNGILRKHDIVPVPSSTSTDFVHYNKITPERITAKFIVVSDYATKDQATLSRKVTGDSRLLEQIYINGTPIFDQPEEEIPTQLPTDYSVYHTFEEEGTYDIEYVLKKEYVGTIPKDMFPPYQYFSEIIIPKGVTTIKTGAFSFISNYPYTNPEINVIIPNTITQVEDNAVYCSYLNSSTVQKFISINPNSVYTSACEK